MCKFTVDYHEGIHECGHSLEIWLECQNKSHMIEFFRGLFERNWPNIVWYFLLGSRPHNMTMRWFWIFWLPYIFFDFFKNEVKIGGMGIDVRWLNIPSFFVDNEYDRTRQG
jgi:hypothetical protein